MFSSLAIFSLFFTVISGGGQFSVLVSPSSLEFSHSDPLESSYVGDVFLAALGNAVLGSISWPGMTILDPFSLARNTLIIVQVQGILEIPTPPEAINYGLIGSDVEDSLNYLVAQLPNETVYNIDFNEYKKGLAEFQNTFGTTDVPIVQPLQHLDPNQYWSHEHFLQALGLINYASQNLDRVLKPSHTLIFRLTVNSIVKVARFEPISEAKKLIEATVQNLFNIVSQRNESVLLVQIVNKYESPVASKTNNDAMGTLNPFKRIESDLQYPIVANIMVWFGLAFAVSVAIISYAMVTMDPGKNSIVYRVITHTEVAKKRH